MLCELSFLQSYQRLRGVVWSLRATAALSLTVGSGRGAAVGVVTEGVDVHAALSVGVVAGDVP